MSWVTELLIESEISYDITVTSTPTTAQTADFISSIENTIKGVLHSVKVDAASITEAGTPIVFDIVQQWALWGSCARVIAAAGGLIRSQTQKEREYWDRYNQIWHEVKESPAILGTDAPFYTGDTNMIWPDGIVADDDVSVNPQFTMSMRF